MTSIIEDAEASYHNPVILHCALCVIMTRSQLTFFSNCITITIITLITIINIIIIIMGQDAPLWSNAHPL